MEKNKKIISGVLCLVLAVAIIVTTSMNFLEVRNVPYPMMGPSVAEVKPRGHFPHRRKEKRIIKSPPGPISEPERGFFWFRAESCVKKNIHHEACFQRLRPP